MADISMCKGKDCGLKETCYRYNASPSKFQSYIDPSKTNHDYNRCDYYWHRENNSKFSV